MGKDILDTTFHNSYPTEATPIEAIASWAENFGVKIDKSGLVIPDNEVENSRKIEMNFPKFCTRIAEEREQGKHIVFLPGSYDGIHAGHLSFVVQAADFYITQWNEVHTTEINRSDLFVCTLIDDDPLISEVKKDAYIKVTGKKGPIEKIDDRVIAMAELPVDFVGVAPSPLALNLPQATHIESKNNTTEVTMPEMVEKAIENYPQLEQDLKGGKTIGFNNPIWSIELWQLYLHAYINGEEIKGGTFQHPITRVVSTDEHKYFDAVAAIMKVCKFNLLEIHDVFCMSTKQIVERIGVEGLLAVKKQKGKQYGN